MKRFRLTLLTLPLLLAACSGDSTTASVGPDGPDTPDATGNVIRFETSLTGMTRAEYKSDLSNLSSFMVAALTNTATPETYFPSMEITKQSDGSWKGATTYYWPEQPLQFFAYAPKDLGVDISPSSQRLSDFTLADKPAAMTDVITAWAQGVRATPPATNGPVSLNFRHALARIEVHASNPSDTRVNILGVKICRIPSTGTMSLQQSASAAPTWSVTAGSQKDYIIKGSLTATDDTKVITLQDTSTPQNIMFGQGDWLMLPQQLTPWSSGSAADGAYIAVLCQVYDGTGLQLFPDDEGKYGFTAVPINTKWEAGHQYIYTLNFFQNAGSAGLIDPNPTSPDGADDDIDTTPGGNRQGGDVVVNKPITFTVTVSDWENDTTDNSEIDF